jgi:hypothetical protein
MQPDFSALFGKAKVTPLHFRIRPGACAVHDVEFLSSYLHDACFKASSVTRRGKKVTITLERDCWELGFTQDSASSELHTAKCRLTVAPVSALLWETSFVSDPKREFSIESIYLGAAYWETPDASQLILSAPHAGWKLTFALPDKYFEIRLNDLERPYLDSERKSNPTLHQSANGLSGRKRRASSGSVLKKSH